MPYAKFKKCGHPKSPKNAVQYKNDRYPRCRACGLKSMRRYRDSPKGRTMWARWRNQEPLYPVWNTLRARLTNPKARKYDLYGGKGYKLYHKWRDFEQFKKWALANGWKPGLVVTRHDPNGHFFPSNCYTTSHTDSLRRRKTWGKVPLKGVFKHGHFRDGAERYSSKIYRTYDGERKSLWLGSYRDPKEAAEMFQLAVEFFDEHGYLPDTFEEFLNKL